VEGLAARTRCQRGGKRGTVRDGGRIRASQQGGL